MKNGRADKCVSARAFATSTWQIRERNETNEMKTRCKMMIIIRCLILMPIYCTLHWINFHYKLNVEHALKVRNKSTFFGAKKEEPPNFRTINKLINKIWKYDLVFFWSNAHFHSVYCICMRRWLFWLLLTLL